MIVLVTVSALGRLEVLCSSTICKCGRGRLLSA